MRLVLLLLPAVAWASCASRRPGGGGGGGPKSTCASTGTADAVLNGTVNGTGGDTLRNKLVIVTGGDTGLGYAAAWAFAHHGAYVVIGNRNVEKGKAAASQIRSDTGGSAVAMPLDLTSWDSVKNFTEMYTRQFGPSLNILVNNAGIDGPSNMLNGYERVFYVDYLSHFLLTEMLLPSLRNSAKKNFARIVNVASGAHENACEEAGWPSDCFKNWEYLPPGVVPHKEVQVNYSGTVMTRNSSSYGVAKFANVQHAAALALLEKDNGIQAYSVSPGYVNTSMTAHHDPDSPWIKFVCDKQKRGAGSNNPESPCPFAPNQGAAIITMCATKQGLQNGGFYSKTYGCQQRPVSEQGFPEKMVLEFYRKSRIWVNQTINNQPLDKESMDVGLPDLVM